MKKQNLTADLENVYAMMQFFDHKCSEKTESVLIRPVLKVRCYSKIANIRFHRNRKRYVQFFVLVGRFHTANQKVDLISLRNYIVLFLFKEICIVLIDFHEYYSLLCYVFIVFYCCYY